MLSAARLYPAQHRRRKTETERSMYSYIKSFSENGILCKYLWYDSISTRWKQQQQIEKKKLGKKSLMKKKREENSFVLGTQVKYYDRAWCLNFMVINYLTQHHHRRHHHQCTKEEKKYTKQNKYLSKKTEWESIWYLFDWLHSIFDVFPPLFAIFLSKNWLHRE